MDSSLHGITPLRQRMTDDMRMRKLAEKKQSGYIHVVRQFTAFLGRSPDTATIEDLRRYQLHLIDHGVSPVSLDADHRGRGTEAGPMRSEQEGGVLGRHSYNPYLGPVAGPRNPTHSIADRSQKQAVGGVLKARIDAVPFLVKSDVAQRGA